MLLVERVQGVDAGDLLQLGAQALDLSAELGPDHRVLALVRRKVLLRLVQRHEGVPDAHGELLLVGDLPGLEALEKLV